MRGHTDQEISSVCRKEEGWSHILGCEGTVIRGTNCWERKVHKYIPKNRNREDSFLAKEVWPKLNCTKKDYKRNSKGWR
jgi:hypothetical protein